MYALPVYAGQGVRSPIMQHQDPRPATAAERRRYSRAVDSQLTPPPGRGIRLAFLIFTGTLVCLSMLYFPILLFAFISGIMGALLHARAEPAESAYRQRHKQLLAELLAQYGLY